MSTHFYCSVQFTRINEIKKQKKFNANFKFFFIIYALPLLTLKEITY